MKETTDSWGFVQSSGERRRDVVYRVVMLRPRSRVRPSITFVWDASRCAYTNQRTSTLQRNNKPTNVSHGRVGVRRSTRPPSWCPWVAHLERNGGVFFRPGSENSIVRRHLSLNTRSGRRGRFRSNYRGRGQINRIGTLSFLSCEGVCFAHDTKTDRIHLFFPIR